MGKLRQQVLLLAGLSLFCAFFVWQAGKTAENLLTRGVELQHLTIAIAAPEGDDTADTLSLWLGKMQDVKSYCSFVSMPAAKAEEELRQDKVSAVLELPEDFIDGVLTGENPDVTLTVSARRPLEALLTNWAGGSAADLLTTFQQGIYGVLEVYDHQKPAELRREDVVFGINLRYINWALGRENCFRLEKVSATGSLPLSRHYSLSFAAYFLLALAPVLSVLYDRKALQAQRRLRCVGVGAGPCFAAAVVVGATAFFPVAVAALFVSGLPLERVFPAAVLWSAVASLWGGLLCLALPEGGPRGMMSFLLALLFLFMSGGLLPPTMLPSGVKVLGEHTLVCLMRDLASDAAPSIPVLGVHVAGLSLAGLVFYRNRMERR